jgi:hypothetical protein
MSFVTPTLAAGDYQILVYPGFSSPAALVSMHLEGAFHLPATQVLGAELTAEGKARVVVRTSSAASLAFASAGLTFNAIRMSTRLERNGAGAARPGFEADLDLGREVDTLNLGIRQTTLDRVTSDALAMEVTVLDAASGTPLDREWVNFSRDGDALQMIQLTGKARKVHILAYPNIVNWENFTSGQIPLEVSVPMGADSALFVEYRPKKPVTLQPLQSTSLEFTLPAGVALPSSSEGVISFNSAADETIATQSIIFR